MHLAAVASPNGLGHLQRLLGVAEVLAERSMLTRLSIVATAWQRAVARNSAEPLVPITHWNTRIFEPKLRYLGAFPDVYGAATIWADRMREDEDLFNASVVISDNLAITLAARPDAVLAGSFLWQDVWPDSEFVSWEVALLREYSPPMLCNQWLATDSVLSQTRPRLCSWTARRTSAEPEKEASRPLVEFNVGATGMQLSRAIEIITNLVNRGHLIQATPTILAALPPSLRGNVNLRSAVPSLAVTRPGAQSISEYAARGIPVAVMYEVTNAEMVHNARRLIALEIAVDLAQDDAATAADRIEAALMPAQLAELRYRLLAMPSLGLEEMADYIQSMFRSRMAGACRGQG